MDTETFISTAPIREVKAPARNSSRAGLICLLVGACALLFQLGGRGLNEPDEGRYAEVAREMAVSGDWLVPRLNGVEHLSKPPITYWLTAASIKVFGANEFAARLPAALAALGTMIGIYLLVNEAVDATTATWVVVVLLSCTQFFIVARLITTDMLLTCFVTWSVWALWRWYVSSDRRWRRIVWFYVFLGLGMTTKGPVALALPAFAVMGLSWRNPDFKWREMCWGRGALVFLVIAAPWFVALAVKQPESVRYFMVREVLQRVVSSEHGRSKPFWYFVPVLAVGLLPWTLTAFSLRKIRGTSERQRDFVRLCVAWSGLGFMLFTVARSKLPTYITPLYVPLAALVAMRFNTLRYGLMAATSLTIYLVGVTFFPRFEPKLARHVSARTFAQRILQDDRSAIVVQYRTFMYGLSFYLQRPVRWFRPSSPMPDEPSFEFATAHHGEYVLNDSTQFRQLFAGPPRVFCVAATRHIEKLREEAGTPLVALESAGDWTLVSNRP